MTNSTNSSAIVDQVCENGTQHVELLPATNDEHGGVIVDMKEAMDSEAFQVLLRASISQWRQQGKKGVWIKLPIQLVNLVETAVKEGFWYHHAEPHYLMLVYWIPETTNTIPANATHRVGVGAFVLKDDREMLVVQEKSGKFRGTGVWKIPTGVVDEGEDIFKAAIREVKEETGIDTEFLEILAFRQSHKSFFGKSDLFFLCILRPLSFDIQKQELEIEAAQWMPFEEYTAQPITQKHGLFRCIADICLAKQIQKTGEKKVKDPKHASHRCWIFLEFSFQVRFVAKEKKNMSSAKFVFVLALWLSAFNLGCRGEGSDEVMPAPPLCLNCTICEYPCQPTPLPPPSPPLPYGVPPPPPALPGYPTYGVPPPPPKKGIQDKCPPNPATQCCQYPPPTNYGGYVPYDNHSASSPLPIFVLVIVVLFYSVILF